jgi:peptidoglycan/LPS O-acetylase OafA/YrhL
MTVGEALQTKSNNFNLLRMVGALFIVFGHTILLTGEADNLRSLYPVVAEGIEFAGYNFLRLFFVFSGLMVAMSLDRRQSFTKYTAARVLRILPPILLVSGALAFVVGPLMTNLTVAGYFADPQTWLYVPFSGSGLFVPGLPGVFSDLPFAGRINPPAWTLRYEIICYVGLGMVWLAGLITPARLPLLLATGTAIYFLFTFVIDIRGSALVSALFGFGMSFMLGTAIYYYRDHIPVAGWPVLVFGFLTYLFFATSARDLLATLAFTSGSLWLGLVPKGPILAYNKVGELSYSVYIWHWPIGQTLFSLAPRFSFYEFFLLVALLSIAIAAVSWSLIERPALQRVPQLAEWLRQCVARVRGSTARPVGHAAQQPLAVRVANGRETQRQD